MSQYITMNNFRVALDQTAQFEARWRHRQRFVHNAPGFVSFRLLRGEAHDGAVHYVSHSTWTSPAAFEAWTQSESFVQAHRGDPLPKGMVLSPPQLECFDVVIDDD
jgi:heme-degrading monooxygenase HmoA